LFAFPVGALLVLEPEWRQCAVVRAAPRDTGPEDVRVREQICRHEGAVAVATDADAIFIRHAHRIRFVNGRLRAGNELLHIRVIRRLARSNDRHRRVVDDRVALGEEEQMRGPGNGRVAVR
jgi:hypothetical protein